MLTRHRLPYIGLLTLAVAVAALEKDYLLSHRSLLLAPLVLGVVWSYPRHSLLVAVFSAPLAPVLPFSSLVSLLPILLFVVSALGTISGRYSSRAGFSLVLVLLSLLLFVSLIDSDRLYVALSQSHDLFTLETGLALCFAATAIRPSIESILGVAAASGATVAVIIMTNAFAAAEAIAPDSLGTAPTRTTALGLNPNYLGILLALGVLSAIALYSLTRRRLLLALAGAQLLALPRVESRSGLLTLIVGLSVLVFSRYRSRSFLLVPAVAVTAFLVSPSIFGSIQHVLLGSRTSADFLQSDSQRVGVASLAAHLSIAHPLFGIGYGNFPYYAELSPRIGIVLNTHNDWLRIAAEAGLPCVTLLLYAIIQSLKFLKTTRYFFAAIAVVVAYCAALATANLLSSLAVSSGIWALVGAGVAAGRSGEMRSAQSGKHAGPARPGPAAAGRRIRHSRFARS